MPRTTHNSTTDFNLPQLQNGHRRTVIHDWNNDYNRIVKLATGRDKKTQSKHDATWFSGSHSRGQSLVAHSGDCKRNSRIKNDPSPA